MDDFNLRSQELAACQLLTDFLKSQKIMGEGRAHMLEPEAYSDMWIKTKLTRVTDEFKERVADLFMRMLFAKRRSSHE